jgi:hypothetical protein
VLPFLTAFSFGLLVERDLKAGLVETMAKGLLTGVYQLIF